MGDADDTLTIELPAPVEHLGASLSVLKLREPTAGEMAATDGKSGYVADMALIAAVAGWPLEAVQNLPARAFVRANAFLARFFAAAPPPGDDA